MKPPPSAIDDFEKLLAAQPFRSPPPEWRTSILACAHHAVATPPSRRRFIALPRLPHAWAALASVWAVLALLHFDTPPAPVYAGKEPRPTLRDLERHLVRQQVEIARLLASAEPRSLTTSPASRPLPPFFPGSP